MPPAKIDQEIEAEIIGLIGQGLTIAAIKRLREATGWNLAAASKWVVQHSPEMQQRQRTAPCPYCGQPLRTVLARQCLECGMDWHDPKNVVRRGPQQDE